MVARRLRKFAHGSRVSLCSDMIFGHYSLLDCGATPITTIVSQLCILRGVSTVEPVVSYARHKTGQLTNNTIDGVDVSKMIKRSKGVESERNQTRPLRIIRLAKVL